MPDFKVRFKGIKRLDHTAMDHKPWAQLAVEADHLVTYGRFVNCFERELSCVETRVRHRNR